MAKSIITIEDTEDGIHAVIHFEPTLVRPESGVWEDIINDLTSAQQFGIAAIQYIVDEAQLEGGVIASDTVSEDV